MEVLIEAGYTRITSESQEKLQIIILSSSILHAWQMLQKEKALSKVNNTNQYSITVINKEIEKKESTIFLLMFRRCIHTQKEMLWIQSLENKPCSYLNILLKLAT